MQKLAGNPPQHCATGRALGKAVASFELEDDGIGQNFLSGLGFLVELVVSELQLTKER